MKRMNVSKLLIILGAIFLGQSAAAEECPDLRGIKCSDAKGNFSELVSQTKDETTGIITYRFRNFASAIGKTYFLRTAARPDGKPHTSKKYSSICSNGTLKISFNKLIGTLVQSEEPIPGRPALLFVHPDTSTTYRFVLGTFSHPDKLTLPAHLSQTAILTQTQVTADSRLEIAPGTKIDPMIDIQGIIQKNPFGTRSCSRQ